MPAMLGLVFVLAILGVASAPSDTTHTAAPATTAPAPAHAQHPLIIIP
jgi:hypothetical protein